MVLHLPLALESALQASSNCDHGSIIEGLTTARPHSVLSHTKSTIWSDSNGMRSCWVLFNSKGLHELMKVFRRWQMTSGIYPRHGVLAKALSQWNMRWRLLNVAAQISSFGLEGPLACWFLPAGPAMQLLAIRLQAPSTGRKPFTTDQSGHESTI